MKPKNENELALGFWTPMNHSPLSILVWMRKPPKDPQQDALTTVACMLRRAYGPYGSAARVGGDATLAWSLSVPDRFSSPTCWSIYREKNELCIFAGDLYDTVPGIREMVGDSPELAKYVARHLRAFPTCRVPNLHGIYSCLYVNRDRSCVSAFADPSGTFPVYWASNDDCCVFSNSLWTFGGCSLFQKQWDNMALTEMLTLGFPLAGRTWLDAVKQLQPGRQIMVRRQDIQLIKLDRPVSRQNWSLKKSVRMLRESLDDTVAQICRRLTGPVALALSGGLDSRILLASLHSQHIDHLNFTFHEGAGEPDLLLARKSAEILGESHHAILMEDAVAQALRLDMRVVNAGESAAFAFFLMSRSVRSQCSSLMIGYPGDVYAGRIPGPFRASRLKSRDTLARNVLSLYMKFFTPKQAEALVSPQHRVLWIDVLDEWYESFREIDQQSIMDVYLDHSITYRLQRRTRMRMDQSRWFVSPLYPYMDARLSRTYRSLPISHLESERAHLLLLEDYRTGLERLPSAARTAMHVPIRFEYKLRHPFYWGRCIRERMTDPLARAVAEMRGRLGMGSSAVDIELESEIRELRDCPILDWSCIQWLLDEASHGAFIRTEALHRLANVLVIHNLLFCDRPLAALHAPFTQPGIVPEFLSPTSPAVA